MYLLIHVLLLIAGIIVCLYFGKQYYRGARWLRFALLVTAAFLLSLWFIEVTQHHLWEYKPVMGLVLGFTLSCLLLYWSLRRANSCNMHCECFCNDETCSCCNGIDDHIFASSNSDAFAAQSLKPVSKKKLKKAVKKVKKTEKKAAKKSAKKSKTTTKKTTTKKTVAKKKASKKDDLTKIEGIGPAINGLLNKASIRTFEDLGATTPAAIRKILKDGGSRFTMHDPRTWPRQGRYAAKGEREKLKKYQDDLKGGR